MRHHRRARHIKGHAKPTDPHPATPSGRQKAWPYHHFCEKISILSSYSRIGCLELSLKSEISGAAVGGTVSPYLRTYNSRDWLGFSPESSFRGKSIFGESHLKRWLSSFFSSLLGGSLHPPSAASVASVAPERRLPVALPPSCDEWQLVRLLDKYK